MLVHHECPFVNLFLPGHLPVEAIITLLSRLRGLSA